MSASWNFETFCIFWTPTSQLCYQCVWFLSPIIVPRQAAGSQALAVQFWTSDNTPTRGARFTRHPEAVTTYKMHISPTLSAKTVKIPPTDSGHAGRHHKTVGLSTNSGSINVQEMPPCLARAYIKTTICSPNSQRIRHSVYINKAKQHIVTVCSK